MFNCGRFVTRKRGTLYLIILDYGALKYDNYRAMYFENIRHTVRLNYALLTVSECLFTKHV